MMARKPRRVFTALIKRTLLTPSEIVAQRTPASRRAIEAQSGVT
jgi:hypothetical protein